MRFDGQVAVVTRGRERGKATAAAVREAGGSAHWFAGDTADFCADACDGGARRGALGSVDILVASGSPTRPSAQLFLDTDPDDFPAHFVRQCVTRLNPLRALSDQMIANGKGKVVFLTTDAGRVPTPSESLLGAGAASATRSLSRRVRPQRARRCGSAVEFRRDHQRQRRPVLPVITSRWANQATCRPHDP